MTTPTPRQVLEQAVEALLAVLDTIEPDPDLESTADEEPDLGWTATGNSAGGSTDDREEGEDPAEEDDPGEDNGDYEPSLGGMPQYCGGALEYDLEGGESGETWPESEPSLGWPEQINQERRLEMDPKIWVIDDGEDGGDAEPNGDEIDFDGGENDHPGFIPGGLGL